MVFTILQIQELIFLIIHFLFIFCICKTGENIGILLHATDIEIEEFQQNKRKLIHVLEKTKGGDTFVW